MSPGTPALAPRRSALRPAIPLSNGGFTFAESPDLAAPEARIIWRAEVDPGTIEAVAVPTGIDGPDAVDPAGLAPWRTIAVDGMGNEHVVLSDGWHHIRIDLIAGSLAGNEPLMMQYRLRGLASAAGTIVPLQRFIELCRRRRFGKALFPKDRRIARWVELLRVHDALLAGATQRDIAIAFYGAERVQREWSGRSDSLRSQLRRLVKDARSMAQGEFRTLLSHRQTDKRRGERR